MLKDITLGQFFPGDSPVHKLDPRIKLVLTVEFIVMLFAAKSMWGIGVGALFCLISFAMSKVPATLMVKSLKPIIPLILITSVLNLFFIKTGDTLWKWKILRITTEGRDTALFMVARIILLIIGSSLLTYTTSPIDLTDAIEHLLSPLKKIKVPVHELAMMMTIALRFIPTLIEETDKIMNAQKARGSELDTGSFKDKVRGMIPIFIPLFVSSFRRAEELATAMECRCYHGGEGRTRMKQLHTSYLDVIAMIYTTIFFAAIITLNIVIK
ncbi:energy-coupling factor transport system permease protein [Ruminococcus sp. YE71]|uniref:energy-coupling factor transporter transmembrane component T family protein n=1 Tax=unclassified Ruminococcus TaxID=2608920 RepID=UPI00087FACC9|nr:MULTISPECIES: energy-coupling factor transporter transmembrane component T [unclassified Ruminococcus]SDA16244.1 energy-coupling factor transport system permease protein [Ruminococcus sp. YE78]SFW24308.1 energy-coupling factor transport system permease protein [Ruminococcus sp. YE71]